MSTVDLCASISSFMKFHQCCGLLWCPLQGQDRQMSLVCTTALSVLYVNNMLAHECRETIFTCFTSLVTFAALRVVWTLCVMLDKQRRSDTWVSTSLIGNQSFYMSNTTQRLSCVSKPTLTLTATEQNRLDIYSKLFYPSVFWQEHPQNHQGLWLWPFWPDCFTPQIDEWIVTHWV